MSAAKQKPELTVTQTPTVDDIMALWEQISGTKATPENSAKRWWRYWRKRKPRPRRSCSRRVEVRYVQNPATGRFEGSGVVARARKSDRTSPLHDRPEATSIILPAKSPRRGRSTSCTDGRRSRQ